jgi:hypothetical protein
MIKTVGTSTPQAMAASELQVGDVLLMLGEGPLSQLIAWCGDSIYSHAALVADGGDLIEASASGVRRYPLAQRFADEINYHYIDAFRPLTHDGSVLNDGDRALVLAHAQSLLGIPYPLDMLATLGVVLAVRGKLPGDPAVRLVIREALDHVIRNDPTHMVCSEVVYRSFAECAADPRGRLAPRIVLEPRGTAPFPDIDWKALWDEVWPLLRPERQHALQAAAAPPSAVVAAVGVAGNAAIADDALQAELALARQALGVPTMPPLATAARGIGEQQPIPDPNPKLVTPLDLAATPSHTALGRLMQRPGG